MTNEGEQKQPQFATLGTPVSTQAGRDAQAAKDAETSVQPWMEAAALAIETYYFGPSETSRDDQNERMTAEIIAAHAPAQVEADRLVEAAEIVAGHDTSSVYAKIPTYFLRKLRAAIAAYEKARKG